MPKRIRRPRRQRTAWRAFRLLLAAWVAALAGMILHQLVTSAPEPHPSWFIPVGIFLAALGVHLVWFRKEMLEISEDRREFGLPRGWPVKAKLLVPVAAVMILVGLFLVADALRRSGSL